MQLSVYYTKEDEYLIKRIEAKAKSQRKSKSAVIFSILEKHFEKEKKIGEILCDIGFLNDEKLTRALEIQRKEKRHRLLGEILLDENFIDGGDLERALSLQGNGGS